MLRDQARDLGGDCRYSLGEECRRHHVHSRGLRHGPITGLVSVAVISVGSGS